MTVFGVSVVVFRSMRFTNKFKCESVYSYFLFALLLVRNTKRCFSLVIWDTNAFGFRQLLVQVLSFTHLPKEEKEGVEILEMLTFYFELVTMEEKAGQNHM